MHTDRQADRQTDKQDRMRTVKQAGIQTGRQADIQTYRQNSTHQNQCPRHDLIFLYHLLTLELTGDKKRWMDNVKEWRSLSMPKLLTMNFRRKAGILISAESSLMHVSPVSKSAKGLN